MISAIVAVDENYGIGYKGDLLCNIKEDLKHFKELTTNGVVVMGKKTWDSLPKKPLPNRFNIVITNQERHFEEMTAFIPFEEVVSLLAHVMPEEKWFIIGGGTIYKELLPYCEHIHLTKIHKSFENVDTYFPNIDEMNNWEIESASGIKEENDVKYQFCIYKNLNK